MAEIDVLTVSDIAILDGTTTRVCLNQFCASGPVPNAPNYFGQVLSGDLSATVDTDPTSPGSGAVVIVHVYFSDPAKAVPTQDGDVYTASVFAVDGTTIGSGTWTASYSAPYYPNGSACGPRCVDVTLTP